MKQTYLAQEAPEKKPRFEVYVAGLPPAVDHSSLKAYFRNFGRINKIYIYTQKTHCLGTAAERIKLHCKLTVPDESSYLRILSEQHHCFMGRHLFCQEFKKGRELSDHNAHVKHRRVIVKKVPSYYTDQNLLELIQARLGAVDTIYEFKTDLKTVHTACKRFKSFSVSFKQPEILEKISSSLAIQLPDSHLIIIERFEQRLFKESSGGSNTTTSDQTTASEQVAKRLERVAGERRIACSEASAGFGAPRESLPTTSANHPLKERTNNNARHFEQAVQATFISEDCSQMSSHRSAAKDSNDPNQRQKGQQFGERKTPAWVIRSNEHQASNLRFNVFGSCPDRSSQFQFCNQFGAARN